MELRPIRTEKDYQAAIREIELLFDATPIRLSTTD
jgi:antitoxin component HigA of HigAB toxin-antitoxin module